MEIPITEALRHADSGIEPAKTQDAYRARASGELSGWNRRLEAAYPHSTPEDRCAVMTDALRQMFEPKKRDAA